MSYPAYPEYKDSGVEWLGKVPAHWEVTKLSYITNRIGSGKTPSGGATAYVSSGVPFIRSQNVHDQGLRLGDIVYIDEATDREMAWSRVRPLDVLMNITGASIGRSCQVPVGFGRANVNQHVCVIRLEKSEEASGWVAWFMKAPSTKEQVKVGQTGAAREGLNFEQLASFCLCMPPINERKTIAAFLDHETARIDALVEEQQRLIALLKEKRQAVISHAVTKGLDPDVPMKNSEVEWLGEVPAHWTVGKVKHLAVISGGYAFNSNEFSDSGIQLIRIGNLYQSKLQLDREPIYVPIASRGKYKPFEVKWGDLLMSLTGTLGKRDYGFAVMYDSEEPSLLNQRVAKITPLSEKVDPVFLLLLLQSESYLNQIYSLPSGTKQANLSNSDVLSPWIVCPSCLQEQSEIVNRVSELMSQLDQLINIAGVAISLLQERRSALISAAVTGKIDVRGWKLPPDSVVSTEAKPMEAV